MCYVFIITFYANCQFNPTKWICCTHWVDDDQQSIIRPGSQFHATVLQVKREMEDNDLTVTLKDGRRIPCYLSCVLQKYFGFMDDGEISISTAKEKEKTREEEGAVRCLMEAGLDICVWCCNKKADDVHLLVVQHQIRFPYVSWRYSDFSDAAVIIWIPLQVDIYPFLGWQRD